MCTGLCSLHLRVHRTSRRLGLCRWSLVHKRASCGVALDFAGKSWQQEIWLQSGAQTSPRRLHSTCRCRVRSACRALSASVSSTPSDSHIQIPSVTKMCGLFCGVCCSPMCASVHPLVRVLPASAYEADACTLLGCSEVFLFKPISTEFITVCIARCIVAFSASGLL